MVWKRYRYNVCLISVLIFSLCSVKFYRLTTAAEWNSAPWIRHSTWCGVRTRQIKSPGLFMYGLCFESWRICQLKCVVCKRYCTYKGLCTKTVSENKALLINWRVFTCVSCGHDCGKGKPPQPCSMWLQQF